MRRVRRSAPLERLEDTQEDRALDLLRLEVREVADQNGNALGAGLANA